MTYTDLELRPYHFIPGDGALHYCLDCKQRKDMAPKSGRCRDCASAHKEINDSRKLPKPFLGRAQQRSYMVGHLLSSWRTREGFTRAGADDGLRRLGWFTLPPFQRPPVWTPEQRSKFIESLVLELPCGCYVYNQPESLTRDPTDAWLIDGQQRIGAILGFVAGEFPAFGYHHHELDQIDQRHFENIIFPAIETCESDPAVLEDIYNRLAYGGTPHEPREPTK